MGGASAQAKENEQAQTNFFNGLTQQQGTQFANQQELQDTLTSAYTPIVNAGINQNGYTPDELAELKTSAAETAGANYAGASRALAASGAGAGSATDSSGILKEQEAGVATAGANANTVAQNQIELQNKEQGRQNFFTASSALGGVNSTAASSTSALAEGANGAGSNATKSIDQVDQENKAGSWQTILGGAVGAAASGVASGLTGGLGTAVSKVGSGDFGW